MNGLPQPNRVCVCNGISSKGMRSVSGSSSAETKEPSENERKVPKCRVTSTSLPLDGGQWTMEEAATRGANSMCRRAASACGNVPSYILVK